MVPTSDELVAERFPAVPRNRPDAQHNLPADSLERLLDVHFRQLRHEAVYPLIQCARQLASRCDEVQSLIQRRGSTRLDLQQQLGSMEKDSVPLFAFGSGAYCGVDIHNTVGVVHRFQVDDLRELQQRSFKYRKNAWGKGEIRLLAATDMVLLLRTDVGRSPTGSVLVIPAVVANEVTPLEASQAEGRNRAARIEVRLQFMDRSVKWKVFLFRDRDQPVTC